MDITIDSDQFISKAYMGELVIILLVIELYFKCGKIKEICFSSKFFGLHNSNNFFHKSEISLTYITQCSIQMVSLIVLSFMNSRITVMCSKPLSTSLNSSIALIRENHNGIHEVPQNTIKTIKA